MGKKWNVIDPKVALMLIRKLSGTEDYPFHVEGEMHAAQVLVDECSEVSCGEMVIAEFDSAERFPTVSAIRQACRRLMEECRLCDGFRWQHTKPEDKCAGFLSKPEEGFEKPFTAEEQAEMEKHYGSADPAWSANLLVTAKTVANGKTDWDDFNLQCIRQAVWKDAHPKFGDSKEAKEYRDFWRGAVIRYEKLYPETVAAIRSGETSVVAPHVRLPGSASPLPVPQKPITQQDIDAAVSRRRA